MRAPKIPTPRHTHPLRVALAALAVVAVIVATTYIAVWGLPLADGR